MKIMMSKFLLLFLFLICCFAAEAQTPLSSRNRKAIALFEEGRKNYEYKRNDDAYKLLKKAVEEDNGFYEAYMILADVCNDLKKYSEAVIAYKSAISLQPDRFPKVYYTLAGVEMELNQFAEAKAHLDKMLTYSKLDPVARKKAERRLANATFSQTAISNPVPFAPQNMGDKVNSIYAEYHPSLTVDNNLLIFTRRRPSDAETDNGGSPVEEDFFVSARSGNEWAGALSLGPPINTNRNEGAHCISPDGRFFFFTGCDSPGGFGSCDIYFSEKKGRKWSTPINLGEIINSPKFDSQPTISADGRELVFTSSREGGKGSQDLWVSKKSADGKWQTPQNLGDSINTELEEKGAFLHPDGNTLFFSSSGHPGMGGSDIYYSKRKADGSWNKPKNLGYPINTKADEIHMIVSADSKTGYFASDRDSGLGLLDIYSFELYEAARPSSVTFLRGKVTDSKTGKPLEAQFEIIDVLSNETRVLSMSDPLTGEFLVTVPTGSSYALNVSAKGYTFFSENYKLGTKLKPTDVFDINIGLNPLATGEKIVLRNIFFESGSAELKKESAAELDKLFQFMTFNSTMKVEISGHTDDVGNDDANMKLSDSRAISVVNYLINKGILKDRLTSKGYGETQPIADNKTEEGKAKNRRTEFLIVGK